MNIKIDKPIGDGRFADVWSDVELVSALTLEEIKNYIIKIEDGHVMYETIKLHYLYTGERDYSFPVFEDIEMKASNSIFKHLYSLIRYEKK